MAGVRLVLQSGGSSKPIQVLGDDRFISVDTLLCQCQTESLATHQQLQSALQEATDLQEL